MPKDVVMGDNTDATEADKEKDGCVKKKKASFTVEERASKLMELVIKVDAYELPIPEAIDGIVLALDYLGKSKPNNALRLEKLNGGGLIIPTGTRIPNN